jgi:mono/diheme cytochrome c family protein
MPNLQLAPQEAADIASYIVSTRADWSPGSGNNSWPVQVEVPEADTPEVKKAIDDLMSLYLSRAKIYNKRTLLEREIPSFIETLSTNDKLLYIGERTIGRLGCFGCHQINGFDNAKPIGTPLNGWGYKSPTKLDYGHITEFLTAQKLGEDQSRDGTDPYYQEELAHQTRSGFLFQKLHRPRSYDYRKDRDDFKPWDDRLRMPQFAWSDDPEAIEEVMTFVLGLTGEKVASKYLPQSRYGPAQLAKARGERLIERNNCRGCHALGMYQYTIASDTLLDKVFRSDDERDPSPFLSNVNVSYDNRAKDHLALFPDLTFQAGGKPVVEPPSGKPVVLEGMPIALDDADDNPETDNDQTLYVQLYKAVKIRGYQFGVGDTLRINPSQAHEIKPEGGNFAWLYSQHIAKETGEPLSPLWNKLPPLLLREGHKVQTPWLTSFLRDPYKIRPAAQLRMPRFHWGGNPTPGVTRPADIVATETRDVANYFAARDGAVFPYQEVPEREQAYLAELNSLFGGAGAAATMPYLEAGWTLITKNQCVQCHAIGQFKPTGEEKSHGPNLNQVSNRLRPQFMLEWIANPTRWVPYTAMPQVFPPLGGQAQNPVLGVPKELEGKPLEQIRAVRDMLLNFVTAVERQLAKVAPPPEVVPTPNGAQAPAVNP